MDLASRPLGESGRGEKVPPLPHPPLASLAGLGCRRASSSWESRERGRKGKGPWDPLLLLCRLDRKKWGTREGPPRLCPARGHSPSSGLSRG